MFSKFYELSKLIRDRKEFTEWENDYWVSLLPSMTESQQERLYTILYNEKIELEKLDSEFAKKRMQEV